MSELEILFGWIKNAIPHQDRHVELRECDGKLIVYLLRSYGGTSGRLYLASVDEAVSYIQAGNDEDYKWRDA